MDTLLNNHGMPGNRHVRLSSLMIKVPSGPKASSNSAQTYGLDFRELCAVLEEAAGAGINCLSTDAENQDMLGRALVTTRLHDFFFIVTKTDALIPAGLAASAARHALERSLRESSERFRADWLPLVLLHQETETGYLEQLAACCRSDLAGYCGIALPDPGSPVPLFDHPAFGAVEIPGRVLDQRFNLTVRAARDRGALIFCRDVNLRASSPQGILPLPHTSESQKLLQRLAWELETSAEALLFRATLDRNDIDCVVVEISNRRKLREYLANLRAPMLPPDVTQKIAGIVRNSRQEISRVLRN